MNIRKIAFTVTSVVALLILFSMWGRLAENNKVGYYQIKQSWPAGNMTIRNDPGLYGQWLGTLYTYKKADAIYLSKKVLDGGRGEISKAVRVQFPDGWADIDLVVQYKLPSDKLNRLLLQEYYSSNTAVKSMIRQQLIGALKNTGSLFNSGDAYADKRSDFIRTAREQVGRGLYAPEVTIASISSKDGTTREVKLYTTKVGINGLPIITKASVIAQYGIEIIQFDVKDMDFDPKLSALIEARKDAQKAQQDAITAKAQGDAFIATERAKQEVLKIKDVTIAEKEKEVAILAAEKGYRTEELAALKALETAKKVRAIGEAKAAANKALVAAGLTPEKRAIIEKETAIGVAREMAKIKLPTVMVTGGGQNGRIVDPFEAVGLESFMRISKTLAKQVTSDK